MAADVQTWLVELVRFYRRLGFFGGNARLSDSALADRLLRDQQGAGGEFDPSSPGGELEVLRWDRERVWTEDPELIFEAAQQPYVQIFNGWSKVSRGALSFTRVREEWEDEDGPINVFIDGEAPFATQALKDGDLVDLEIVKDVNHHLVHPFYRFEISEGDDGAASILVLSGEERAQIQRSRELPLHVHEMAAMFECSGLFAAGPSQPLRSGTRFLGAFKDEFERALGRLTVSLEGSRIMGVYRVDVEDIRMELNLAGLYEPGSQSISGTVLGMSEREGVAQAYVGAFKGGVARGGQAIYGTWSGDFATKGGDAGETRTQTGTFGALEEGVVQMGASDPYLRRLAAWLRRVWQAGSVADSPLTLF